MIPILTNDKRTDAQRANAAAQALAHRFDSAITNMAAQILATISRQEPTVATETTRLTLGAINHALRQAISEGSAAMPNDTMRAIHFRLDREITSERVGRLHHGITILPPPSRPK